MSSLLPSSATPFEHSLESMSQSITDLSFDFEQVWDVDRCPESGLMALAWSLSVDTWCSDWPETVKRQHIRDAPGLHYRKGTVKAVKDAVRSFGADITVREWWELEPRGTPRTFSVQLVGGYVQSKAFQEQIVNAIDSVKPLGAHYDLTTGLSATAEFKTLGVARVITFTRLSCKELIL